MNSRRPVRHRSDSGACPCRGGKMLERRCGKGKETERLKRSICRSQLKLELAGNILAPKENENTSREHQLWHFPCHAWSRFSRRALWPRRMWRCDCCGLTCVKSSGNPCLYVLRNTFHTFLVESRVFVFFPANVAVNNLILRKTLIFIIQRMRTFSPAQGWIVGEEVGGELFRKFSVGHLHGTVSGGNIGTHLPERFRTSLNAQTAWVLISWSQLWFVVVCRLPSSEYHVCQRMRVGRKD